MVDVEFQTWISLAAENSLLLRSFVISSFVSTRNVRGFVAPNTSSSLPYFQFARLLYSLTVSVSSFGMLLVSAVDVLLDRITILWVTSQINNTLCYLSRTWNVNKIMWASTKSVWVPSLWSCWFPVCQNARAMVTWTVNCRLPSPTKRITRLSPPSGSSRAARAAPRTAPTEYPILSLEMHWTSLPSPKDLTDGDDILGKSTLEDPEIRSAFV